MSAPANRPRWANLRPAQDPQEDPDNAANAAAWVPVLDGWDPDEAVDEDGMVDIPPPMPVDVIAHIIDGMGSLRALVGSVRSRRVMPVDNVPVDRGVGAPSHGGVMPGSANRECQRSTCGSPGRGGDQ